VTLQNAGIWDFEDVVLNGMTHKPSDGCAVTYTTWPHGLEKLRGFLEHLNNIFFWIQFTMETW
jgi:hypothetical protein